MKKRNIFLIMVIVIIVIAFMLGYLSINNSKYGISKENLISLTEEQCNSNGYDWVEVPGLCGPTGDCGGRCDIKTKDGGKQCYSNSDCEGICSCQEDKKDLEGFQVGKCSIHKYYTEISDCPCILTEKSTAENFPYGCA